MLRVRFGCRLALLIPGVSVALAAWGCSSLQLSDPGVRNPNDWMMEGGGVGRANSVAEPIQPPLEQAWEFKTTGGFGPAPALLLDNVVLVATRKGEVQAIHLETGKGLGVVGMGESIDGGLVVDEDRVMYVPVAWGRRGVYAFDLTSGRTLWRDSRVPVDAGLLLAGDRLVAADVESRVTAYAPAGGDVLWTRTLSDNGAVHAAPVLVATDTCIVGTDRGTVHALDMSDGSQLWETFVGAPVYATAAAFNGIVYVPTTRGRLVALSGATGEEVFTFDAGNPEVRLSSPAVTGSAVVVGGSDGILRAMDPESGEMIWTFRGGEAMAAAPLIAGDHVYLGDMGKMFRAFSLSDGRLVWETELAGRVKSALAAGPGGILVLAEPRSVYRFIESEAYAASE